MFAVNVTKNKSVVAPKELLTSGSVRIYTVQFTFNSDWDGLIKTAVFKAGGVSVSVALDETGECLIPWEVLEKPGYTLSVGVYGVLGEELVLPTVWASLGDIHEGTERGANARDPTPSVYQQLMARLDEGRSAAEAAAGRAADEASKAGDSAAAAEEARRDLEDARDAAEKSAGDAGDSAAASRASEERAAVSANAAQTALQGMTYVTFATDANGHVLIRNGDLLGTTAFRLISAGADTNAGHLEVDY